MLAAACSSRPAQQQVSAAHTILIDEAMLARGGSDTIRLGRLHEGEILAYPLAFRNASQRATFLREVERTCGCTTLELSREPIAPESSRAATLYFDSRGEWGWQLKLLKLHLEGGTEPLKLWVEAEIE